jgi:Tfp pilus assembly protein PilZ
MRPAVLVVARQSLTLLGLAQALLKFGYQLITAFPDLTELERAARVHPSLVVLRPPLEEEERRTCLQAIKKQFRDRGIPVLACVSIPEEAASVRAVLGEVPVLTGSPIRLNDLYGRIQEMFKVARRKELRITAELVVAHREPGVYTEDFFYYDTLTSLSLGGCFIRTESPYPVGSNIELVFCMGSASESLKVMGKVQRHGDGTGSGNGMGVRFEAISSETAARLESYLMNHLGTMELPASL